MLAPLHKDYNTALKNALESEVQQEAKYKQACEVGYVHVYK